MTLPSLRGVGPGNTGTGTGAIVVTLPTHVAGDLLVVQISQNSNRTFSGITSGWLALRAAQASGTALTCSLFYKVATSSSEPNPSFTPSATLTWAAGSSAWIGADTIASIAQPNSGTGAASGTAIGYGTLALPGQPDCLQVFAGAQLTGTNATITPPADFTEQYEVDNSTTVCAWLGTRDALVGPAAPAAATATSSVSARWVGQSFLLRSTEYATFRSATNTVGADVTSQTITKPPGAQTDELLVMVLSVDSGTIELTGTLNGWTQIGGTNTQAGGGNTSRTWGFYRRVQAGDPATYTTPVVDAVGPMTSGCACYYRVPTTGDPIDGSPSTTGHTAATPVAVPEVTTTVPNTTLILAAGSWNWQTGWSGYAAEMTERIDPVGGNVNGIMLADEIVKATGATGTRSTTPSTTGPHTLRMYPILSTTSVAGSVTGAASGRSGALAQSAGAKVEAAASAGRAGARGQVVSAKVETAAAVGRVGARAQNTDVAAKTAASTARAGARSVVVGSALQQASGAASSRAGARATAAAVTTRAAAAVARTGARALTAGPKVRTTANASSTGARAQAAATPARTAASLAKAGTRAQAEAVAARTAAAQSTVGAQGVSVGAQGGAKLAFGRLGARGASAGAKVVSAPAQSHFGALAQTSAPPVARVSTNAARAGAQAQAAGVAIVVAAAVSVGQVGARGQCVGVRAVAATAEGRLGAQAVSTFLKAGTAATSAQAGCTALTVGVTTRTGTAASQAGARGTVSIVLPPMTPIFTFTVRPRTRTLAFTVPARTRILQAIER